MRERRYNYDLYENFYVMNNLLLNDFHASSDYIGSEKKWIFLVFKGSVILRNNYFKDDWLAFDCSSAELFADVCKTKLCIGQFKGIDCEVWALTDNKLGLKEFVSVELRDLLVTLDEISFAMICRSVQLVTWHESNIFCGRCGEKNSMSTNEHCFVCKRCNLSFYPKISPCIIVAIISGDKCLLARQSSWPAGRYSALAGFIESGETAEQAVNREVMEEVGIEITNLTYFGSQSWPFPGQLMLGYIGEAKDKNLRVNELEIAEAKWFKFDELPIGIPPSTIMSGRLIERAVLTIRNKAM